MELAGAAVVAGEMLRVIACSGSFAADFNPDAGSDRGAGVNAFCAFVSASGFACGAGSDPTLAFMASGPFIAGRAIAMRGRATLGYPRHVSKAVSKSAECLG